jgi:uncharacterized protein (TIGR00297 family)
VSGDVRRAGGFALVGTLALVVPLVGGRFAPRTVAVLAALPFVVVAGLALFVLEDGPAFELFARPGDYEERRLFGLGGFALAGAGLALLATRFGLPAPVYVASVFVLTAGNLASEAARTRTTHEFAVVTAFAAGGLAGGVGGVYAAAAAARAGSRLVGPTAAETVAIALPGAVFLAATGALAAALLRSMLFERDDPLVMVSVALVLWLFVDVGLPTDPERLAIGLVVTVGLGYVAYALETASIPGMLTGVLLALLAIVLGGYGWFVLMVTFFGLGGLSTKFRYEEKRARGIAEADEGARGSGNVLANAAVALIAVVAFAASARVGVPPPLFRFAFAGSVAAALADTFSSEIGGLYDDPRLLTTFERVEPGTDGAITAQGELAGLAGAGIIAGLAALFFGYGPVPAALVVAGGFVGMTVDSLLGATLEGGRLNNQGVNFLATLAGGLACALLALALGFVAAGG